jgi:D-beta-D-heptose 7-phosphate kinase/D-beta-D-heptose 1-phosphate adenosyltransferase
VAIDTDRRVKELKGNDRPINSQEDRKFILECIRYVDEVVVFDSKDELKSLYDTINPFVVVKGYEQKTPEEIRSHDEIPSHIKVILCPFQEGYSTTGTMRKIKSLSSWEKRNTV